MIKVKKRNNLSTDRVYFAKIRINKKRHYEKDSKTMAGRQFGL